MRLFLFASFFVLLPSVALQLALGLLAQSHSMLLSTILSLGVHFVQCAALRCGNRAQWRVTCTVFLAAHALLVWYHATTPVYSVCHVPTLVNTAAMLLRQPRWSRTCQHWPA